VLDALARLLCRHAKLTLVLTGVFLAIAGWAGATVAGRLATGQQGFVSDTAPSVRANERYSRLTGQETGTPIVVLMRTPGPVRAPAGQSALHRLVAALRAQRGVGGVRSPLDDRSGALVSRDGHAALVLVSFRPDTAIDIAAIRAAARSVPGTTLSEATAVFDQIDHQISSDIPRIELIAVPLLLILSFLIFRGLVAGLLPLFVAGVAVAGTLVALRILVELTPVSSYALNIATGLGFGLAIDYSLFMVSRYREELARTGPGPEALAATLDHAGRTVIFSATTVALAFLCLPVFGVQTLTSMGIAGATVAVLAAVAALVPMSALLSLLGERVNALAPARLQRAADRAARPDRSGSWYRLAHAVMKRAPLVAALCIAVLLAMGLPALHARFGGTDARVLPSSFAASRVLAAIADEFPADGASPILVLATAGPRERAGVARYAVQLRSLPGVFTVRSPHPIGRSTWLIPVVPRGVSTSSTAQDVVDRVRSERAAFTVTAAGGAAVNHDVGAALRSRFVLAAALISVTTLAVLFVMTRSVLLPIKSLLMTIVTLTATAGLMVVIFQDGGLADVLDFQLMDHLNQANAVVLFFVVFGLSTDYGVFLLARIKEAHDAGHDNREAVALGLERSGRIVTAAALLFCVAVGVSAIASVRLVKEFGVGAALAVLIDATIIRALLVPALMALFGRANWWAPKFLRGS
jgi:uncharacterized membrane protein YdfJ with MMPL/SSD domain